MAFRPNKSFRSIIDDLGLSTGLQLCLDAGDLASYPGSGQTWFDRAQGNDFFLGATSGAEASDPTFNGTAGNLKDTTYWSFDGGDYFTSDAANPAWMNDIHKAGAKFTAVFWSWPGSLGVKTGWFGGEADDKNEIGVNFYRDATSRLRYDVANASATLALQFQSTILLPSAGVWHFLAISHNDTGGAAGSFVQINTATETFDGALASPNSAAATQLFQIGAVGLNVLPLENTSRFGMVAMWNRNLSAQEVMSIYQYPGVSFTAETGVVNLKRMIGY